MAPEVWDFKHNGPPNLIVINLAPHFDSRRSQGNDVVSCSRQEREKTTPYYARKGSSQGVRCGVVGEATWTLVDAQPSSSVEMAVIDIVFHHGGERVLDSDNELLELVFFAERNGNKIHVYYEHEVSVPELVEDCPKLIEMTPTPSQVQTDASNVIDLENSPEEDIPVKTSPPTETHVTFTQNSNSKTANNDTTNPTQSNITFANPTNVGPKKGNTTNSKPNPKNFKPTGKNSKPIAKSTSKPAAKPTVNATPNKTTKPTEKPTVNPTNKKTTKPNTKPSAKPLPARPQTRSATRVSPRKTKKKVVEEPANEDDGSSSHDSYDSVEDNVVV
ncbi:hypothetical protein PIB30_076082 [Stylosanthes scabra]|uniref:Uncharacterized protein n=1 Tax=Stylosanthes scabra TaxID=79078 RepID=A0ABU6QQC1_9FABA|nr:hypothetical protein [Stylosanthes scabra]